MKIKLNPVKRYPSPSYPTKDEVMQNSNLLKMVPQRWRAKPAVIAVLSFTLSSGLFACSENKTDKDSQNTSLEVNMSDSGIAVKEADTTANDTTTPATSAETASDEDTTAPEETNETVKVTPDGKDSMKIPIFEYGEGRGFYGCSSVSPPVFFSEDEAQQIINEEAQKAGVNFSSSKSIYSSRLPVTQIYAGDFNYKERTQEGYLELDGYDKKLKIGYEFVSQEDVYQWRDQQINFGSSVKEFDMRNTAERLSNVLEHTAVFYDPLMNDDIKYDFYSKEYKENPEEYYSQFISKQQQYMKEELRKQVRDFFEWLAAQGII